MVAILLVMLETRTEQSVAALKNDYVGLASEALSDLNIFAAVVALLESGLNHSPTFESADRIIAIAKREQGSCLNRYDAARAMIRKQIPTAVKSK